MNKIRVGVIGLGSRGKGLLRTILACEEAEIVAVCDVYEDRREMAKEVVASQQKKAPVTYENYEDLIKDPKVDAVVIASSWDEHTRMAVASMKAGKYTALEVGGAYDLEDCWQLVRTYEETKTPIMMLENCCFDRYELLATSLVRAGRLGKVMYCHGAYAHELRGEILGGNVNRHYRLKNYMLRNCENYPTHELGPIAKILNINRGNKMISLTSVATKSGVSLEEYSTSEKSPDASLAGTKFAQGDIVVTTITCAGGEVITLRLDTTLPRYYSREFTVRGTKGLCVQESNSVFLESEVNMHEYFNPQVTMGRYLDNAEQYERYLPDVWRNVTPEQMKLGHGGMDYIQFKAFFGAIVRGEEMPLDVYDMAAWMAITPLSEQSIAHGGMPQAIPDFTRGKWMYRPQKDVMELPTPEETEAPVILGSKNIPHVHLQEQAPVLTEEVPETAEETPSAEEEQTLMNEEQSLADEEDTLVQEEQVPEKPKKKREKKVKERKARKPLNWKGISLALVVIFSCVMSYLFDQKPSIDRPYDFGGYLCDVIGHFPGRKATCEIPQFCRLCREELNPAAHTPGTEATCTTAQKCTLCNLVLKKELGHTPGAAATCTTPQTCKTCNTVLKKATGHTVTGGWEIVTEATDTTNGLKIRKCSVCGEKTEEQSFAASSGLQFTSKNGGTCFVSGIGTCRDSNIVIPSMYNGMRVTSIGDSAFWYCSGLTSITIPDSVTSIGNRAFYNCTKLTSITISDSVTSIGNYAFYNCGSLTSITIPGSVKGIDNYAFYACNKLTSITVDPDNPNYASINGILFNKAMTELIYFPEGKIGAYTIPGSVTSIGNYAFYYCNKLTSITIPNSVTSIGNYAFYYCTKLTSVTIPDSVTSIGSSAFSSCTGLTSVTIGNSVTSIGSSAFSSCTGLTSVTIGNSVTSIGSNAFDSCYGLTSITIPDSVTSIGSNAFRGCSGLTSVTIGDGITSIEGNTFSGLTNLTSITIGKNVKAIEINSFQNCRNLKTIQFTGTIAEWNAINKNAYWNIDIPATKVTCSNGTVSIR